MNTKHTLIAFSNAGQTQSFLVPCPSWNRDWNYFPNLPIQFSLNARPGLVSPFEWLCMVSVTLVAVHPFSAQGRATLLWGSVRAKGTLAGFWWETIPQDWDLLMYSQLRKTSTVNTLVVGANTFWCDLSTFPIRPRFLICNPWTTHRDNKKV